MSPDLRVSSEVSRHHHAKAHDLGSATEVAGKQYLFDQGEAAANRVWGLTGQYVCPLCQVRFEREALGSGELTVDHAPPEAIGGTPIILTCKRCNNTAGHTIDADAASREALQDFQRMMLDAEAGASGRAIITWGNERLTVDVEVDKGGTTGFKVLGNLNDPAKVRAATEYMQRLAVEGRTDGYTFQVISFRRFNQRHARVSDLRSAFLLCVAKFGYSYGFNITLGAILRQISNPDDPILDRWWFDNHPDAKQNAIAIAELDGIVIVTFAGVTTLLPWPTHSIEHYRSLMTAIIERKPVTFTNVVKVPWPTSFEAIYDHARTGPLALTPVPGTMA